ncbi:MAG: hypothetical protein JO255_12550 [Alphaproteobacteria bacterium]|nr:hypothetical protein [Alphaproteobacteria bacterium]
MREQGSSGRHRLAFGPARLLLIALTGWALAMMLPALARVVVPFASFGLSANNDGVIIDIVSPFDTAEESPAAKAGLVPGDRLDLHAMRCAPPTSRACAGLIAVLGGLGGMQYTLPGREIELSLLSGAGGAPRTVALHAALSPLDGLERLVLLSNTVVGILFVATAFWLVWTRPSRMTWGFFLYAMWFNPGQTYAYYAILQSWPVAVLVQEAAEALAQGAAYAGLFAFALRFPGEAADPRWRRAEQAVPWIGVLLALPMLLSAGNLFGVPTERITEAGLLSGYLVIAAVLLVLLRRKRQLPPQDEQRMRWAIAGCAIGIPAFIAAEICQSSGLLQDLWGATASQAAVGLLYLLNGVLAYFVGTAVWRRRVVSVAIPLRHGTITTALMLLLGIPVVYLHERVAAYHETLHLPEWIWPLLVAPVVLFLFQHLHEIAVELVDHAFNRRFHRAQHRLGHAGQAMAKADGFAEVDRLLVAEPVHGLRLSSAAMFRWSDGALRRVEPAPGWEDAKLSELRSGDDALVLQSLTLGRPVRLRRGAWRRAGLPADDRAPCLAVPVCGGAREGVGVALFGPHQSGNDITADERDMLHALAKNAALAYDRVETELLRQQIRDLQAQLATLGHAPAAEAGGRR